MRHDRGAFEAHHVPSTDRVIPVVVRELAIERPFQDRPYRLQLARGRFERRESSDLHTRTFHQLLWRQSTVARSPREVRLLEFVVLLAALLVSLVAGLLLIFAVVVMPGLGTLDDRGFLAAFKAIDRVIQDNQPVFVMVWGGSILAVIFAAVLAVAEGDGLVRGLVLVAAVIYLLAVQVSTFVNNIPLNNQLQTHDLETMSADELADARAAFEPRWNAWNRSRTVFACLTAALLLVSLVHL